MESGKTKQINRQRRHNRIRARVIGTAACPRLAVYKSNRYLHAQLIDDAKQVTLLGGTTQKWPGKKMIGAEKLGEELAKRAKAAGITTVVFDRGGFRYTGRVAIFAEAVRKGGIKV